MEKFMWLFRHGKKEKIFIGAVRSLSGYPWTTFENSILRCSSDNLFSGDVEEIYIDARDAMVKIVCLMGGKIIGEPYEFCKGNVTPALLTKSDYRKE